MKQSETMHACDLGQISPGAARFWPKTGGQLGRKCGGWLEMTCTIPIPGFLINVCDLILTLECFCSSLQSFARVLWARETLKLSVFGQFWGSACHEMVCLDEKDVFDSHPRLNKHSSWTKFAFGLLLQQSPTICTCHLGQISPGATCFCPTLGVSLAENVEVDLKMPCTLPIPVVIIIAYESILTLECFCSCLQPCAYIIRAKLALEFVTIVQIWGSAWQ